MFVIGCWLGYIISIIIYHAFLYKIKINPPEVIIIIFKKLGLYLSNITIGLFFGVLAFYLFDYILIIVTALCGSYIAIFSLSLILGKFPIYKELI